MRLFSAISCLCFVWQAYGVETLRIETPRGTQVAVTVHFPEGRGWPVLIVAPGQRCNSKGALFEAMGSLGEKRNVGVVRFEWSYCGTASESPSNGLKNEVEDMMTVLAFVQKHPRIEPKRIVLAGKSMGSSVAYRIFSRSSDLKSIALLTPICSETRDENDQPLPEPISVADRNYPGLNSENRPVLFALGNQDEACVPAVLFDYLKRSSAPLQVHVVDGDHGFRVLDEKGEIDSGKTSINLESVVTSVLSWVQLQF